MVKGRGGMGSHKHYVSGRTTKSPKQRLFERIEAEKKESKGKVFEGCDSVKELLRGDK